MLTKLEAVNQILEDGISEAPVDGLGAGVPDANKAERYLDRVSKEVQAKGWRVNRYYDRVLLRDAEGRIPVADTVLRVTTDGTKDEEFDVVPRKVETSRFLFDKATESFVFDNDLTVNIVYFLDFEELTPELQMYITVKATVEFQKSDQSSAVIDALLQQKFDEAWAALQDTEAEESADNVLKNSRHCRYIVRRHSRIVNH